MSKPLITIVSANYNDSLFKELMLYAFDKLTFNSFKAIFMDNGSDKRNVSVLRKLLENYDNLNIIYQNQNVAGSQGHGEALDKMVDMVETEYTVVMDSDCTFLMKHWDELLLRELNDKIKIIGSTSPIKRAGNRIGGGDFPLPFATLFETDTYKKLNISCTPGDINKGEDTCWEWKTKFVNNGYSGKSLVTRNTRDYKDGPFGNLTGIEEYYTDSGELIASHFGRGASSGLAKYLSNENNKLQNLVQSINPRIGKTYAKLIGKYEMKLWLKKCYKIVNSQL